MDLDDGRRTSGKEHYVKVVSDSAWQAVCKVCRAPVIWAKTITNPRWVLFNAGVEQTADKADENGIYVAYYPSTTVHWKTCVERRTGEQPRQPDAGERAGS